MIVRVRSAVALLLALAACTSGGGTGEPQTGSLTITISGLPSGPASVTVNGPNLNTVITATTTLAGLTPGTFLVTPASVHILGALYAPSTGATSVSVAASSTPASTSVTYVLASGIVQLNISGLPGSTPAAVRITGGAAYDQTFTTTQAIDLDAGAYTVTVGVVAVSTTTYGFVPQSQPITVTGSLTPQPVNVVYSAMTGQLAITVTGLPGGGVPSVLVTGPFAYSHSITTNGVTTLTSLPLGDYTVTASGVTVATIPYSPHTPSQTITLAPAVNGAATVLYETQNLVIDGMYITQATQRYNGTVPLVAGRDGYLRVFVKANFANTLTPKVRVRWYSSATLVRTDTILAPGSSVPTAIDEGTLASSWNLAVPNTLIQLNLSVVADVDPDNLVVEGSETDNSFPLSGTPLALDVRTVNVARVTLVPVSTPTSGTGNVNAGNQDSYLDFTNKIHPLPSVVITLHSVYSTATNLPLQSNDGNGAWETILTELDALRTADHAPAEQYYYGVVDPSYTSGVAGLGYIAYPVAMGWDKGINDQILAHEIGHNWAQYHAPCGGPSGVDPNYPYPGATLGIYGLDVATLTPYAPTTNFDIMSYCRPYWTTDYTYDSVMSYRSTHAIIVSAASAAVVEPALLVWGHMKGGRMVLEPAFEIEARAQMPEGHGAYTIEGLDANDAPLFSYAFEGREIADVPGGGARAFSFAIPLSRFDKTRLASLRLTGNGGEARVTGTAAVAAMRTGSMPESKFQSRALSGEQAQVTWDAVTYPMAMVRDASTGEVLSFARGGSTRVKVRGQRLEVTLSDGVRSVRESVETN